MKVFISWSGEESRLVAQALREYLPQIIQAIKPWMSEEDINKGARWRSELTTELDKTSFGIFCLTKENLTAPWLLFEAGAVSKKVEESFVCTYLIGLTPGDVPEPLSQFHATVANKEDTRKLLLTINKALKEDALKEDQLSKNFEKWWPDLQEKLKNKPIPKPGKKREERELLEEILSIVRDLNRMNSPMAEAIKNQSSLLSSLFLYSPTAKEFPSRQTSHLYAPVIVGPIDSGVGLTMTICEACKKPFKETNALATSHLCPECEKKTKQ